MDPIGLLMLKLRKLLRSRGRTVDDTDDLIQEAFLRLQLYCQDKPVKQPEAFLVRTALNLAVDEQRRPYNRMAAIPRAEMLSLIDTQPSPEDVLATQQRLQRAKQAVDALSPRLREVFMLNRVDGYSYAQIAEQLGISTSTVEKHIARAALFFDAWLNKESQE